jgi:phospholipid/cholesterol/gamma-HCH transport system substrate-binding protein
MKTSLEFKVGLMTIFSLSILMVSILFINNFHIGGSGRVYTVTFGFLGDLKVGSPVKYAGGIEVGQVQDIRFDNGKAAVDLVITNPQLHLRKDSMVAIYSTSLLGTKYVQVGSDLGSQPELQPGDKLEGKDSNNLDLTFSEIGDVMESFEKMMGDPKAKENFLHSFDNMNKATDQLLVMTIQSRSKVEKMIDTLSQSSGNVTQIVASAQKVSQNLANLTGALNKQQITQSMKDLNNTLQVMNEVANDSHQGKGAIGVLLKDEQMANDVKGLVEELKAHPWKLLWKQ